jgi:tetratricopeptide (TPR) repeat protein
LTRTVARREHRGVLLIALLLAAGPSGHRAKAERAEALGRMTEAAREYETAWQEEQAPELLYRLGIVRRKLKQYGKAREAFRAYLREAPEGGLRDEVERQLAKLEVLIEAQSEDYSDEPPLRKPPPRAPPPPPVQPQPAPVQPVEPAPPPAAPPAGEQRSPPQREQVNTVHQPEPQPAPAAALAPAPIAPEARARAAPWLAGGAAATAVAGAYFWWDGSRLSRDLDARYASGDLAPADRPSYSRAHNESLAGRLLVAAAAGLLAGAVVLWW